LKNKLKKFFVLALLALGLWLGYVAYTQRDRSTADLLVKYGTPASQFIEIDGVRLHYRDTGSGPAVVLVHASFASLVMWEPWARELEQHYRVIRLDLTSHGLTGADPTGDYSMDRTLELFARFLSTRGLDRFAIVGTSVGGTIGLRYAAAHPDRVTRLVLINPGALEGKRMKPGRDKVPGWANVLTVFTPRAIAKYMLTSSYGDKSRVSDALIDEWWEMWLHEGNRRALLDRLRQYRAGDIDAVIGDVQAPVVLVWGERDPQTPVEQAVQLRAMLARAASVDLVVLPGVGHMAVQEAPAESLAATEPFLRADRLLERQAAN